jgi:uncharacterized Zn-binding protein involved in type VI secretion
MKNIIYVDDDTSHGGKVLTGSDLIKVGGRRAARVGDRVSCPEHGENDILEGSSNMKDGGIPLARDGDHAWCGCVLIASSSGVRVQ